MSTSKTVPVKIKLLFSGSKVPEYARPGDMACDLFACLNRNESIPPGERKAIPCGFAVEMPPGYGMYILPRSGLTVKHGIVVANTPGLIDNGFRGEIKVILHNIHQTETFQVFPGARIAQAMILPMPQIEWTVVQEIDKTERNDSGLGSTGL
jgi:dUTP pyrophosphatase